jgi:hypothetical protein
LLLGILIAHKIPYTEVQPFLWKRAVRCPKDKSGARARASQVFPNNRQDWALKCEDGVAEAALLAYYGSLLHTKGFSLPRSSVSKNRAI